MKLVLAFLFLNLISLAASGQTPEASLNEQEKEIVRPTPSTAKALSSEAHESKHKDETWAGTGQPSKNDVPHPLTWGEFDPGKGMLVGKNEMGSMSLSF